jgi:hypothetical protein
MSRTYSWSHRAKAILSDVKRLPFERIARAEIEQLFNVENHAAQRLMRAFGAESHAGPLFLTKAQTIRGLKAVVRDGAVERTTRRLERVAAALVKAEETHAARNTILPVTRQELARQTVEGFPDTIELSAGELRIRFDGMPDLLAQLMRIATAAMREPEKLEAAVQPLVSDV